MSNNDHRLLADYREVVKTIRQYKNINLINTSGEPVDEYDIEYKVKGYTIGADGKVSTSRQHRIKIKIPFGYPHFPPTIKPLSPIFHPEIDDHVVPIANYWEEHKSLPDLVVHIGNMICGRAYNLDAPFNSDAAKYFEEHQTTLPLDSLKRVDDEKKKPQKKSVQMDFLKPLLIGTAAVICLIIVLGGGLYVIEQWRLGKSEETFAQARTYLANKEFKRAQNTAETALDETGSFFVLRSSAATLKDEITAFLQAKELNQGLQGKVKYGDEFISIEQMQKIELVKELLADARIVAETRGPQQALEAYQKALEYAEENNLAKDREVILKDLSRIKLSVLVAASEKAHESKNWDWAIEQHTKVLDFIKKNGKYLEGEEKQAAKTRYLLLIDRIAYYSQMASAAENRGDLREALKYHNSLIDLIGKSGSKNNSTLKKTLLDSMQQAAILTEKINIENRRQWLLKNYKEIFQAHYPAVLASSLRSPQALFVKYDEENMVFNLSCLDKSTGTVVRLRLFYEYNPETQQWSVYDGVIEDDT